MAKYKLVGTKIYDDRGEVGKILGNSFKASPQVGSVDTHYLNNQNYYGIKADLLKFLKVVLGITEISLSLLGRTGKTMTAPMWKFDKFGILDKNKLVIPHSEFNETNLDQCSLLNFIESFGVR